MSPEHGNKKRGGSLAPGMVLSGSQDLLPQACLNDHAPAAWVSQQMVFWMGRNSGCSLGLGVAGRGRFILWVF